MGIVKKFFSYINEDNLDEEYDDYLRREEEEEEDYYPEELPKKHTFTKSSQDRDESISIRDNLSSRSSSYIKQAAASKTADDYYLQEPEIKKERAAKNTTTSRVVPIRNTSRGLEVKVRKPTSFEDSQDICDVILSGCAVIINLEGFDVELAQRVMDFVSGSIYAVNGKLHQISNYIFIASPDNVDISGDYAEMLRDKGLGVPNLTKGF